MWFCVISLIETNVSGNLLPPFIYQTTWCHTPVDHNLDNHWHKNLKSHIKYSWYLYCVEHIIMMKSRTRNMILYFLDSQPNWSGRMFILSQNQDDSSHQNTIEKYHSPLISIDLIRTGFPWCMSIPIAFHWRTFWPAFKWTVCRFHSPSRVTEGQRYSFESLMDWHWSFWA
jgi:hypothetical protein